MNVVIILHDSCSHLHNDLNNESNDGTNVGLLTNVFIIFSDIYFLPQMAINHDSIMVALMLENDVSQVLPGFSG